MNNDEDNRVVWKWNIDVTINVFTFIFCTVLAWALAYIAKVTFGLSFSGFAIVLLTACFIGCIVSSRFYDKERE
jgi:hypothetical protein